VFASQDACIFFVILLGVCLLLVGALCQARIVAWQARPSQGAHTHTGAVAMHPPAWIACLHLSGARSAAAFSRGSTAVTLLSKAAGLLIYV